MAMHALLRRDFYSKFVLLGVGWRAFIYGGVVRCAQPIVRISHMTGRATAGAKVAREFIVAERPKMAPHTSLGEIKILVRSNIGFAGVNARLCHFFKSAHCTGNLEVAREIRTVR